ncbi:MAG: TetR/AcrR family transcriptional regulator [Proteobacteria bacterium]|nr:TetR/AcrR family transcriptional regulator [Pseudomonadota bacterium]
MLSSPKKRAARPTKLPTKRPGPAGGARDRNRQATQQRLAAAALALFLERGTAAVTIDEIVARAGMAKGSFYRYARDKADLVAQILAPVIAETTGALDRCERALQVGRQGTLAAIYLTLARELSVMVAQQAACVLLYLQEARSPASAAPPAIQDLADRLTSRTIALTEIARDHGLIRAVDPEVSALAVLGATEAMLFAHLRGLRAPSATVPRVTAALVDIVLRGIGLQPRV